MKEITIKEHDNIYQNEEFKKLDQERNKVESCNLFKKNQYSENPNADSILSAYYIGIDWLMEDEFALVVNPKIVNLDYLSMFMTCFNHADVSSEINKTRNGHIYQIYLDQKSIPFKSANFEITPLIIIHFLKVLERIVKRGLKKDYIRREENLSSKIKGKILFSQHLKKNEALGRKDRVYCNYQDYSVDCLENQILKKAVMFCQNYLSKNLKGDQRDNLKKIAPTLALCQSAFQQVSDLRDIEVLKQFKVNKLYRDYDEALKLAHMILRRFSYNTQESHQQERKIPPFWINMALLFEMYVLAKLKDTYRDQIEYQYHGNYGEVDFLKKGDEKVIIDAKYKNQWIEREYEISDIRQLSGYARDTGILNKLGVKDENTVVPCLIIYPIIDPNTGIEKFESGKLLGERTEKIGAFSQFYKIGIQLPTK